MELVPKIIIFLILLFLFIEGLRLFVLSKKEYLRNQNKYFPKLPFLVARIFSLFYIIFSISVMEKMLFYSSVDIILSLKISVLLVLIYLITIFIKK